MTQNDENKLSMARNTLDVLNSNMTAVSTIEAFVTAKNRAAVLITEITEEEGKIKSNNTGIADDKKSLKKEITSLAYELVACVKAYADETNNMELFKNIHFTESYLARVRDEQFGPTINSIIKVVDTNKIELKKHGLEQEDTDNLIDLMEVWDGKKQQPRKAILTRQTSNQTQDQKLEELMNILNRRCDNYAGKLKRKYPEFYTTYTHARQVINYGTRHEKTDEVAPPPANPPA